jgi:hypothetical protein
VQVHAPSATASFAACVQLFGRYPLAITPNTGGYRSMVLMTRHTGSAGFFVLTQAGDDLFLIRSWNRREGVNHEIRPGEPASGVIQQLITGSMPLPRDGSLLGWVADNQVTTMLVVHCRHPETWDGVAPVPEIRVMPMAGTSEVLQWPPFTASPLEDGRLWQYVSWGQIVDIVPLITQSIGSAFWVPSPDRRSVRHGEGFVVIMDNLPADEYWLPAGVYMDHWTLREGIGAPPVGRLLTLPGVEDLAYRLR